MQKNFINTRGGQTRKRSCIVRYVDVPFNDPSVTSIPFRGGCMWSVFIKYNDQAEQIYHRFIDTEQEALASAQKVMDKWIMNGFDPVED